MVAAKNPFETADEDMESPRVTALVSDFDGT